MDSLSGKVALITGAAAKRGMGHAVASRFAEKGASLVILDKYSAPKSYFSGDEGWGGLDEVADEIKSLGREALALVADINSSQEVETAIAKTLDKFGKIDILVHCAGTRGPMNVPIVDLDEKIWREVVDVNLTGTFIIAKAIARSMIEKGHGGKIVLISSLGGIKGMPGSGSYCASKWGVLGLMKTMALELAQHKINVNAINPGSFGTHLRDETYVKQAKAEGISVDEARQRHNKQLIASIPLGRLGELNEIADLALYLVTDQSSYITGEAINITGGVT
jgi:3-oxoacyl-[acyl-carrier protein] reductase/meso-butanediol dehydrogenase/(S,S)-butanediol dehydrogenase/diacetyl reductase